MGGLRTWLVVLGLALDVLGCSNGKRDERDPSSDEVKHDPEPDGEELDSGEEQLDADDARSDSGEEQPDADDARSDGDASADAADAQGGAPCYSDSECGAEEVCYQPRDLDCDGRPVVCNSYWPRRSCAGECRAWTTVHRPCNAGCPRGYSCPADIHGSYGACVRRVGVGASCYPYGGDCLEGLLCDFNTFRCVSGSSVPGTPCTSSCAGNSWCVNGACQPQSQRGAACVYGSCGPLDYCADPDGYGPMTGTCVEQQGASCSTTGCGQAQYCADPDGSGPLPGRCVRLLADGELCRREDSGECSSGFCSFATATIDYRCVPRLSEGDTCGPAVEGECAPSLLCLDDNRCHTLLTLGMPCGAALPVANLCAGDLTCSVATGKCEAPPSGPVVCEEVNAGECPSGLVCAFADPACDADAGACARLCRARVAAGARCKSHAECESDSCYDGKCADQVCVRKD